MEGDLSGDALDIEEESGGEADYSFAIDRVIGVSCVDGFL